MNTPYQDIFFNTIMLLLLDKLSFGNGIPYKSSHLPQVDS